MVWSVLWRSLTLVLLLGWVPARMQEACETAPVGTRSGAVCGLAQEVDGVRVERFLGIPYAESTAGANRFAPPVPKAPWSGVFAATAFGDICPQNQDFAGLTQSEDCLSVNVWRPVSATPDALRPVLVFIHGGAFVIGSSADPLLEAARLYDGAYLAASQDVVVVTFNYRLGVLGFLAGVAGLEGNFGLMDQQLALLWVQDNIRAFGGNPNVVTLAGESAGASSAALHLAAMPSSAPLFSAAILQSTPFGLPYKSVQDAASVGELFLLSLGCQFRADQLGCLRARPLEDVLAAQRSRLLGLTVLDFGLAGFLTWAPVVDGELVTRQPLQAAQEGLVTKPVLLGTNAHEATIFFATPEARPIGRFGYAAFARTMFGPEHVERIFAQYPVQADNTDNVIQIGTDYLFTCANRAFARDVRQSYLYAFTHVPSFPLWNDVPRCEDESCHGEELAFVFGSAAEAFTPEEADLSQRLMRYWGRFTGALHTPNPGLPGSPSWRPFGEAGQYAELGVPLALRDDAPEICAFWDAIGYDLGVHERREP